jgi:4-alpha-glucanotransferase
MNFKRGAGILHHVTSLPSRFGIGDLGPAAYEFVETLAAAGQKYWQILPLGQTGYGNSPYGCFSAFAGNIYLISPEKLVEDGFLNGEDIADVPEFPANKVDYGGAIGFKNGLLIKAFERFRSTDDEDVAAGFHSFCDANNWWLEDYAFFQAYREANDFKNWHEWDVSVKDRESDAMAEARTNLDDAIFAQKFYQFAFFAQWEKLHSFANEKGIAVIGDISIYVAFDSADVWCNRDLFKLEPDGKPKFVAGVPPDYFSKTGQLWGNPTYDWELMRENGFHWWTERIRFNLKLFDIARIDHFIGFGRAWEVPGTEETAVNGEWVEIPGRELFTALYDDLGEIPLIAEDLGEMTPEIERLRDEFGIPGMRVLQFAFGGDAGNIHLPHNYRRELVVYTGTHDNDTTAGWVKNLKKKKRGGPPNPAFTHALEYLRSDGKNLTWDMIRAAYSSVANIAIIPTQDILGLDNRSRMNLPASTGDNWSWRMEPDALTDRMRTKLRELAEFYAR